MKQRPLDVALVSCAELPEPDPDAAPLAAALAQAGIAAEVLAWDDPAADWTRASLTVLRSTWNYPEHREAFLDWAGQAASHSTLWNPLQTVRWNTYKGYLLELGQVGVPVTPTALVPRRTSITLAEIVEERGWTEVVVKPAISAASSRTRRFSSAEVESGEEHLQALLEERDALVQRFLPFAKIARRLHYDGVDRVRSVRRLFDRHGVPYVRRDRNTFLATEAQFQLLMGQLTCSQSAEKADITIVAERSASAPRSGMSRSTLRDAVNAKLQRRTRPSLSTTCSKSSFMVVPGGKGA